MYQVQNEIRFDKLVSVICVLEKLAVWIKICLKQTFLKYMCVEIVKQKHMAWALFTKKTLTLFLGSTLTTDIEILTGHQNTLEYRDMSKKYNI